MPQQGRTREDVYIDAMVEMVEAVNGNFTEDSLLRLYQLTLLGHLGLSRFVLWVEEDGQWIPRCTQGVDSIPSDTEVQGLVGSISPNGGAEILLPHQYLEGFTYAIPTIRRQREQSAVDGVEERVIALLAFGGDNFSQKLEPNLVKFLKAVTHMMTLAIYNRRLEAVEAEQQRLRIELAFAEQVQMGLYPKNLPSEGKLRAAASMIGFGKVSGDYYDFIPLGGEKYIICLADVSGKGMSAALLMANFQAGLRSLVNHTRDLPTLLRELNAVILHNGRGDRFVTAFLGLIDMRERTLSYINAAHPPALLAVPNGEVRELSTGTTLVGIFPHLHSIEVGHESLPEGFRLLMYTDGVTETFNPAREEFGYERLADLLRNLSATDDLALLHATILRALTEFRDGAEAEDDVTIYSLEG